MIERLSARQREVVGLLARGYTTPAIAEALGISAETARTHVQNARYRLEVRTQAQLAAIWAAEEAERLIWQQLRPEDRHRYFAGQHHRREQRDLRIVVRDQRAHIRNLEDQLLGLQGPRRETGEQGAML